MTVLLLNRNLVGHNLILVRACHTHWIDPAIRETKISEQAEWWSCIHGYSVREGRDAIRSEELAVDDWTGGSVWKIDIEEACTVHIRVLRSVCWNEI